MTKTQPIGLVIASHGRHFIVALSDGTTRHCFTRGKKSGASVGDKVRISLQGSGEGVIEEILERRNLLYRSDQQRSKQFAANIDLIAIVIAVEPSFSEELISRALVAAGTADIDTVILLNKVDITDRVEDARSRLKIFSDLGVPTLEVSAIDAASTHKQLLSVLQGRTTLLLGQSGMGKSTLLNALVPDAQAATGDYSVALDAGRHTTTSTRLYSLPEANAALIDSPGFQSFGLFHLSPGDIERGFPEFAEPKAQCRFYNCSHRNEPSCGVLSALGQGQIAEQRHALYLKLLDENASQARY